MARSAPLADTTASSVGLPAEVVAGLDEGETEIGGEQRDHASRELRVGPDTGSDGGAAEGQLDEGGDRLLAAPHRTLHLAGVAEELLTEPDRRRVLEVGPSRS